MAPTPKARLRGPSAFIARAFLGKRGKPGRIKLWPSPSKPNTNGMIRMAASQTGGAVAYGQKPGQPGHAPIEHPSQAQKETLCLSWQSCTHRSPLSARVEGGR